MCFTCSVTRTTELIDPFTGLPRLSHITTYTSLSPTFSLKAQQISNICFIVMQNDALDQ